ncbi:MAG: FAD-dependent oxidoreductase [Clostridia bacterium]|nr:FAD-dependent oxidoreductase [Clostridia bacterium]
MKSLWQSNINMPTFPTLEKDIKTDVLIIGGGIAGILTAYFLHQKGIDYALVEKSRICSGNTQNTTAKITVQHGYIYSKILKGEGLESAQMYLAANQAAFDEYARICKNIECDYEIKDNCVFSFDGEKTEDELDALQRIGFHAEFAKELPLPIKPNGSVIFKNQAQFHPIKFLSAVADRLNIYENTFVRELIGTKAVTNRGNINAQKVIVTTHFPFINKHGSYFLKLYQHRSYVIALENSQDAGGMYVDENDAGLSFRNHGSLLLLGGGGHKTGKDGGSWNELRAFAKKHYPDSAEKYYWSAQDCMSLDSMPYIGRYSKNTPNLYAASGFNKWGMTGAMLSAMILSDLITDKRSEFESLFSPSRSIIKPQLFINGFESAKNLMTFTTKRCPHLGCALKWNKDEHSWDCPCHGSRFSQDGKVLDNPANGDLKK